MVREAVLLRMGSLICRQRVFRLHLIIYFFTIYLILCLYVNIVCLTWEPQNRRRENLCFFCPRNNAFYYIPIEKYSPFFDEINLVFHFSSVQKMRFFSVISLLLRETYDVLCVRVFVCVSTHNSDDFLVCTLFVW